jgi:hypothetical protein
MRVRRGIVFHGKRDTNPAEPPRVGVVNADDGRYGEVVA